MNRIQQAFQKKGKDLLNMYFTAGYPTLDDTVPLIQTLAAAGADIIEIGMPFSDPLADGPVIQRSSTAALANGMNMPVLFGQLQDIRQAVPDTPLLLMGYLNPVMQFGVEDFCRQAAEAGVDGIILPDLPLDEYVADIPGNIPAATTCGPCSSSPRKLSEARIRRLDELTDAFLYLVSGPGTTGGTTLPRAKACRKLLRAHRRHEPA